jgi:hypothetical protein
MGRVAGARAYPSITGTAIYTTLALERLRVLEGVGA